MANWKWWSFSSNPGCYSISPKQRRMSVPHTWKMLLSVHEYFLPLAMFLAACLFVCSQRVWAGSSLKNSLKRSRGLYVLLEFSWCPGSLAGINLFGSMSGSLSVFQDVAEATGCGRARSGDLDLVLLRPLAAVPAVSCGGGCSPEYLASSGEAGGLACAPAAEVLGSPSCW